MAKRDKTYTAKRDRYRLDYVTTDKRSGETYVDTSYHGSKKEAHFQQYQNNLHSKHVLDPNVYSRSATITKQKKRFKAKQKAKRSKKTTTIDKRTNQDYQRGQRWGYAVAMNNVKVNGKYGVMQSDALFGTARKYAKDPSIKKTKSGKKLDFKTRCGFAGIADGVIAALRKLGF